MAYGEIIPRLVESRLVEALDDSPAVLIHGPRRRAAWYRDYVEAIVQRDVRDLARVASLRS